MLWQDGIIRCWDIRFSCLAFEKCSCSQNLQERRNILKALWMQTNCPTPLRNTNIQFSLNWIFAINFKWHYQDVVEHTICSLLSFSNIKNEIHEENIKLRNIDCKVRLRGGFVSYSYISLPIFPNIGDYYSSIFSINNKT